MDATSSGNQIWFLNTLMTICRSSAAAPDGVSIIEFRAPYGDAPPTHLHHDDDEIFHLIEGRMRFRVGDEEFVLEAGHTVVAPKGVPHAFRVESREGAHGLNIMAGPNFENFVRAVGRPAETAAMPVPAAPTPALLARLREAAAAHHMALVGPPLA
jgi:mannose-6-phosphate isomerase-like protein (cupin superfamily)